MFVYLIGGGPEGTRTLDLSDANRTLSRTELQARILFYPWNNKRVFARVDEKRRLAKLELRTARAIKNSRQETW